VWCVCVCVVCGVCVCVCVVCVCVCVCVWRSLSSMQSACTVLSSMACLALHIFPHYHINGTVFGKKLLNIKCVFWFSLQLGSEIFLAIRNEGDMIVEVHKSSCKIPVILVPFEWNLNFLYRFSKKTFKYQISWKSVQWEPSCSMRTDGHYDAVTLRKSADRIKAKFG